MADVIYNNFYEQLVRAQLKFDTDEFKLMLVTSGYTPDIDTHEHRDDVTNEVSGTGYTSGGEVVSNITVTQDNTNDQATIDGDDITWSNSSITARGAVLYKNVGTAATDILVKYFDFGSDQTSDSSPFTISFSADGILQIKAG